MFYDYPATRNARQSRSVLDMPAPLDINKTKDMFGEIIKIYKFQNELNEISRVNTPQQWTLFALKNAQTAIQQIYSNFVLMPKFSVAGISGFVCPKCVQFEAIPIKNLGFDRTMQHRHICSPSALESVLKNPDYRSILSAVELEANENLFLMTKRWLSGASFLNSRAIPPSITILPEVYVLDAVSDDWLWQYTGEEGRQVDDKDLKKFLAMAKATYAIFNFPGKGRFFMYVSCYLQNNTKEKSL